MMKSKIARKLARKRGVKFVIVPLAHTDPKDLRGFPTGLVQMDPMEFRGFPVFDDCDPAFRKDDNQ